MAALPDQPACVVNCAAYARDGTRTDLTLDEISEVLAVDDGRFVWVGVYEPDESLLDTLQEEFGLHDLAVEDAHHAHQRPKIEAYGNSLFLALHTAQGDGHRVGLGETHVFLGERYLVTVRHGASASYAPARERMEREAGMLAHGPSAGLYAVLDQIVDGYAPILDEFNEALNALERDIFDSEFRRSTVRKLYDLKREVMRLKRAVAPLQDILGVLTRSKSPLLDDEIQLYFRDVLDHAVRVNETTDTLREMLTSAVSVNLSLVTVYQGEVVKRLGAWAALLAAPTLIASWYGMNFEHMPELHGRWSYAVLVGLVAVVCAVLYRAFKRSRWL